MSPQRTKHVVHSRDRSEVVVAIAVGAGIVLATALLIWLLRPGAVGVRGKGGIMARQPRVALWVVGTGLAVWAAVWWSRHGRRRPSNMNQAVLTSLAVGVVMVVAIVVAFLWPGGFQRHYPSEPKPVEQPKDTNTTIPATTPSTPTTTSTSKTSTVPTTKPSTASTSPPTTKGP